MRGIAPEGHWVFFRHILNFESNSWVKTKSNVFAQRRQDAKKGQTKKTRIFVFLGELCGFARDCF
jgi:hypothetical protein